ncbi:chaperonin GroEL, partial [Patescibacteria group bacterium]|nr:chaperonin GroEL [Patescibacteria group bacterium]
NSGADAGWVMRKVEEGQKDFGFNTLTLEFGSMLGQGILDPAKVTRSALQNAASVASMILTTECLICDRPTEDKDNTPSMPAGMGGMGM